MVLDADNEKWRKRPGRANRESTRLMINLTFKTSGKFKRGKPKLKAENGDL